MLCMSLDSHWTGQPRVFVCLYHWGRLGCAARRQAVEVRVVGMIVFLDNKL